MSFCLTYLDIQVGLEDVEDCVNAVCLICSLCITFLM